jgi:hypothetical protein
MGQTDSPPSGGQSTSQIIVGLILLGMGAVLLVDRYSDVRHIRSWWPLIPILMGVARLATTDPDPKRRAGIRRSGAWFIMIGLWALVSDSHVFGLTFATSWPLLMIGTGVIMVWRALETGGRPPVRREP